MVASLVTPLLIDLFKEINDILFSRFSSTVSKTSKTNAWESNKNDFANSLLCEQNAEDISTEKLKKKWENINQTGKIGDVKMCGRC
jgi:hypothetical protein